MKRSLATGAVAFVVSQVLAIAIHGFILHSDYEPYYGTLLRPMSGEAWQAILLPVVHVLFITALVMINNRISLAGDPLVRGLKLGGLGWLIGYAPQFLLWYAEQPWPGTLVVKQLCLELVAALIIGVVISVMSRRAIPVARPA
jgi:hypothetical protein